MHVPFSFSYPPFDLITNVTLKLVNLNLESSSLIPFSKVRFHIKHLFHLSNLNNNYQMGKNKTNIINKKNLVECVQLQL